MKQKASGMAKRETIVGCTLSRINGFARAESIPSLYFLNLEINQSAPILKKMKTNKNRCQE